MKNMIKLLMTLFILTSLLACTQENLEYEETNNNYIKFSHKEEEKVNDTLDFIGNDFQKKKLLLNTDLAIQDLSLTTTFEILTTDTLNISTGMTLEIGRAHV